MLLEKHRKYFNDLYIDNQIVNISIWSLELKS